MANRGCLAKAKICNAIYKLNDLFFGIGREIIHKINKGTLRNLQKTITSYAHTAIKYCLANITYGLHFLNA